jgi:MFS family permease
VCARLPQGMVSLTLLLVAAQHASMTVAGLVVAGYTLGQAATGPARGRLADRRGLVPVAAAGAAGMHHAPFGKNDRRDRGGAVPWLPGPTGGQA